MQSSIYLGLMRTFSPSLRERHRRLGGPVAVLPHLEPPEPDNSSGLEAELENAAADEIIGNIHDTDKLAEVAKASIVKLGVDEVCTALIDAWDEDHIRQLCDRLRDHFTKLKDDLSIPPAIRRPLAQPTLS
jgi:hypothetical protein